eukprot:TRINITY_DN93919_c0_g1_i1.p1 TRINITY_DN93919_c0_g1~~TRINITY_DN93919_c0_g1_i1.p1  ORF type:complete len:234 (-),score=27.97 TRINITY_DN93919_c0_g1_i1:6-707(-)
MDDDAVERELAHRKQQLEQRQAQEQRLNARGWIHYTPKTDDTLTLLAIRHDTTVENIQQVNNLLTTDLDLLPSGTQLVLPKLDTPIVDSEPAKRRILVDLDVCRQRCLVQASKRIRTDGMTLDEAKYYLLSNNDNIGEAFQEWKADHTWEENQGGFRPTTLWPPHHNNTTFAKLQEIAEDEKKDEQPPTAVLSSSSGVFTVDPAAVEGQPERKGCGCKWLPLRLPCPWRAQLA